MHKVVKEINRPEQATVNLFEDIPPAAIADASTSFGNSMDPGIKPVYTAARLLGTAVTVDLQPGDNLLLHKALKMADPGDVLVANTNGDTTSGVWGDNTSTSAKTLGLAGTIVDGAVRDVRIIEEIDYPVFSRTVTTRGSGKSAPGSINVPISCGGLTITPGDIVVGDRTGVVAVDPAEADTVASKAKEKMEAESAMKDRAEAGEYIYDFADLEDNYEKLNITEE